MTKTAIGFILDATPENTLKIRHTFKEPSSLRIQDGVPFELTTFTTEGTISRYFLNRF